MTIDQNNIWKSSVYALLVQTSPEILKSIDFNVSRDVLVAANLIATSNKELAAIELTNLEDNIHHFYLNLDSKIFQSKGNWVWVKELKIYYPRDLLINVNIRPRIIDIPYTNNFVCAHWLFKHLRSDIVNYLETYL
ncbi:MAG: hypothetical protein AAGB35_01960 [Pseudomonadota bacterium]